MLQHIFNKAIVIAFCPQEFLEIQGEHFVISLIAHTVAFNFSIIDAQHRAAADHIEPAVDFEEFQCCGNFRERLQLIKEYQCFAFDKSFGRIHSGDILDDILCFISICRDHFILRFFHEVDDDHALIIHLSKPLDRLGFAYLSGTLDDQRLSVRVSFPFGQESIDFSFQVEHFTRLLRYYYSDTQWRNQSESQKMSEFFLYLHIF